MDGDTGARIDNEESLLQQIAWLRDERDRNLGATAALTAAYEKLHRRLEAALAEQSGSAAVPAIRRWFGSASRNGPTPSSSAVQFVADSSEPTMILPIRLQAEQIEVRGLGGQPLWASVLSGDGGAIFQLEYSTNAEGRASPEVRSIRLRAGERKRLDLTDGSVWLRRPRGELYLLKLEAGPSVEASIAQTPASTARSRQTLWRAQEMSRDRPSSEAIVFAQATASGIERSAIHLLEANQAGSDERLWLSSVNRYLQSLGVDPIELLPEGPSHFHRLAASRRPAIEQGPLVTVLMPVFNAEQTLEMAARSILAQSWRPLELILIDDASADGSAAIAKELARSDPRVRYLRNAVNVGPYVSKNVALGVSRGRYITVHDADDWAHPQRLEDQVAVMERSNGRLVASLARMVHMDDGGKFIGMTKTGQTSADGALRDAPMTCFFEADFMRSRLGYWDSVRFGADGELIERVQAVAQERFERVNTFALMYRVSESSLTHDPVHGISRDQGLSPTRRSYRDQWRTWHRQIDSKGSYMAFPPKARMFEAPSEMLVPVADISAATPHQPREQQ